DISGALAAHHSFPTRRSSDLGSRVCHVLHLQHQGCQREGRGGPITVKRPEWADPYAAREALREAQSRQQRVEEQGKRVRGISFRSEEHTSELQSRENLVCRLL